MTPTPDGTTSGWLTPRRRTTGLWPSASEHTAAAAAVLTAALLLGGCSAEPVASPSADRRSGGVTDETEGTADRGRSGDGWACAGFPSPLFDRALNDEVAKAREVLDRCLTDSQQTQRDDVALQRAALTGAVKFIRLLLAAGADPNFVDAAGRTALLHAARPTNTHNGADQEEDRQKAHVCRILIAAGGDVNHRSEGGNTALQGAAAFGMASTVRALLANGAALDRRNSLGNTPLLTAAANGHSGIVSRLIAAGAHPTLRNDERDTAADLARRYCHPALARRLERRYGAHTHQSPTPAERICVGE